jgi:hypothetical protein
MSLRKFVRATVVLVSVCLATEVNAEQLCFRTSDCEETEVCKPVSGSAMGICKALVDRQAQRRAQDTENFSIGSTIGNSAYGHEFSNEGPDESEGEE